MSGLMASARKVLGRGRPLEERLVGLDAAVTNARGRLDDDVVDGAEEVVRRAGARLKLTGGHTVVALAGATGSGKSSTFNALCGLDVASVGVRRPTTSVATACTWGDEPAVDLLDWLEIPPRRRVERQSLLDQGAARDAGFDGLVLLDLPDHDSTEVAHHLEVDRLIALTDLMVWVLDPQKYADAAIHRRFLTPLAGHSDVMLVVLNHVDTVASEERASMLADVRRLLDDDGLGDVPLLAVSARTGEGIDELRAVVAERVADKRSTGARLGADVTAAAARLSAVSGDAEPRELRDRDQRELLEALSEAAGVPLVVDAVRRATTVRARRATGWPVTSWLSRLKPDPLRRLHLDRGTTGADLVASARSSVPTADQVQRARVDTAVRDLAERASTGLAPAWIRSVRAASTSRAGDLEDRLDGVVGTTDLGVGALPAWTRGVRALQLLLLLVAVAGAAWLGVLAVMSYLQSPVTGTPRVHGIPVPTGLLLVGVAAGIVLALLSRWLVSLTARSRARAAHRRLRSGIAEVGQELVVGPLQAELAAYRATWEGLRTARK